MQAGSTLATAVTTTLPRSTRTRTKTRTMLRGTGKEKEREKEIEKQKEKDTARDKPRRKFVNATKEELWALQRVLDSREGNFSSTYKKNSEANNKVYDKNHRTVATLDRLAKVYETFEDTWDIMVEGDMLFASEEDAADKLDAAQQQQDNARCFLLKR